MDISPAKVTGAVEATRARVIWRNGKLYVFRTRDDVEIVDAPERPVRVDGRRRVYETAGVRFEKSGCTCGCAICRVTYSSLLRRVMVDA